MPKMTKKAMPKGPHMMAGIEMMMGQPMPMKPPKKVKRVARGK